jgi:hypothetical protein
VEQAIQIVVFFILKKGLWYLTPLSTTSLLMEETGVPRENHPPAAND